jgi:hypothetical protein
VHVMLASAAGRSVCFCCGEEKCKMCCTRGFLVPSEGRFRDMCELLSLEMWLVLYKS